MTVTLFTRPTCFFAFAAENLVKTLGLDVEIVDANKETKLFDSLFPENRRLTPAIYDSESKLALNQSIAVNDYLLSLAKDPQGFYGKTPAEKYEVLQWESYINGDIVAKLAAVFTYKRKGTKPTPEEVKEIIASAERGASVLEKHLTAHTYLVGEQVTLADLFGAGAIAGELLCILPPSWRKEHRAIVRWVNTIVKGKYFHNRLGNFELPTEDPLPALFAAPAAAAAPKAAAKPAPAAEEAPAKPAAHPLAALGKSSVPIDELKRNYSNKETREEALPWFWNEFYNPEEWSIWRVDYKYNDELTMTFMSNNLIGGFFARLTASLKYMFGAAVVYGENNNNGIVGAFVVRGQDFEPAFDVAPDWDSYKYTRLDASNPADRETLNDLWAWDKPIVIDGTPREIADGKVLK